MKRRAVLKFGAGLALGPGSARRHAAFIKEDTERWAPAIRASGARVE